MIVFTVVRTLGSRKKKAFGQVMFIQLSVLLQDLQIYRHQCHFPVSNPGHISHDHSVPFSSAEQMEGCPIVASNGLL